MNKSLTFCLTLMAAVAIGISAQFVIGTTQVFAAANPTPTKPAPTATSLPLADCGEMYDSATPKTCTCESGNQPGNVGQTCCGWYKADAATPSASKCYNNSYFLEGSMGKKVTQETIDSLNPLILEKSALAKELSTPAGILNRVMSFAFPIAGLILFVMIVFGGFEMMTGAANKKNIDQGKQRVTAAIIGFVLLFSAYWLVQIVEKIFNLKILGN